MTIFDENGTLKPSCSRIAFDIRYRREPKARYPDLEAFAELNGDWLTSTRSRC
jgi:hypothetical protein